MKIIEVKQGSPKWIALRAKHDTASEAPSVMGASKRTGRNELLRVRATGDEKEISVWVQENLFDKGHEIEALARPFAEGFIGEDLYPVVALDDEGNLLASYDGLTMMEDICWECKLWNEAKADDVKNGKVPEEDYWQVVQQLAIMGGGKCLYTVSDGTEEKTIHVWLEYNAEPVSMLKASWAQFNEDLINYQHVEPEQVVVAEPVLNLPSVNVKVSGAIDIVDNFTLFEKALTNFLDNEIIREPQTDQDFANLDLQIKSLKKAETSLNAAEEQMLSQVESIDKIKRTKDMLLKLTRDNRLMAEKLLTAEKQKRRNEILQGGIDALASHVAALNTRIGKDYMPDITADFVGEMKGKRTITSLKEAADTTLAKAKIESNEIADRIQINLNTLKELADGYQTLFPDTSQIVLKQNDDLTALVKTRISDHKEAEAEKERLAEEKRIEEEKEAERIENEKQVEVVVEPEEQDDMVPEQEPDIRPSAYGGGSPAATNKTVKGVVTDRKMPSYSEIISVLANHYQVKSSVVEGWLVDIRKTG